MRKNRNLFEIGFRLSQKREKSSYFMSGNYVGRNQSIKHRKEDFWYDFQMT
jgi:hypothetical protein